MYSHLSMFSGTPSRSSQKMLLQQQPMWMLGLKEPFPRKFPKIMVGAKQLDA